MKRKILSIMVVGMFLLTCITAISAGAQKTQTTTSEEVPDFEITKIRMEREFTALNVWDWYLIVTIKNIGTKDFDPNDYEKNPEVWYRLKYPEDIENPPGDHPTYMGKIQKILKKGKSVDIRCIAWVSVPHVQIPHPGKYEYSVYVDENNYVSELDDIENNVLTKTFEFPRVKNKMSCWYQPLLSLLNNYPIISWLLNLR